MIKLHVCSVLGIIVLASSAAVTAVKDTITGSVAVNVASFGRVNGIQLKLNSRRGSLVDAFLGIPFAKPPLGSLRFRPPQSIDKPSAGSTTKTYNATRLPPGCIQNGTLLGDPKANLSEDCLYLNIWRPSAKPSGKAAKRAVMVWIHGGAFVYGSISMSDYNGKILASAGDVIVVSIQYRLGALGFLALGDIQNGASGNAGLLDQQLALKWVQDYITAFGGDTKRVTLFGESAGSASVNYHLLSSGSAGLFRYAIMESAAVPSDWSYISPRDAPKHAREFSKSVGCYSSSDKVIINCLRSIKASNFVRPVTGNLGSKLVPKFVPTVDGTFIRQAPDQLLAQGNFQKKDLLTGFNANEGYLFLIMTLPNLFDVNVTKPIPKLSRANYTSAIQILGLLNTTEKFVLNSLTFEFKSDNNFAGYAPTLDRLLGDSWFCCPVVNVAKTFAKYADKNMTHSVYMYNFNHRSASSYLPSWAGAVHGEELPYVFGNPSQSNFSVEENALSNSIIAYWTKFAKTGDPNHSDPNQPPSNQTNWPKYTIRDQQVLVLATGKGLRTQKEPRVRECDYWLNIVPQLEAAAAGCNV